MNFSKMMGNFLEVLNLDQLLFKLNRFNYNLQLVLPVRWSLMHFSSLDRC